MVIIDEHDLGKTKIEVLMDLIYESTGLRIPEHYIKYGLPKELDARPDVLDDPNTFIPVHINPDYDFHLAQRDAGFMYRRRSLQGHFEQIPDLNIEFDQFPTTLHHLILEVINPQLTYPLDCADFVDYPITDHLTASLHIVSKPDSFLWFGTFDQPVTPPDSGFYILVEEPELTGFAEAVV